MKAVNIFQLDSLMNFRNFSFYYDQLRAVMIINFQKKNIVIAIFSRKHENISEILQVLDENKRKYVKGYG